MGWCGKKRSDRGAAVWARRRGDEGDLVPCLRGNRVEQIIQEELDYCVATYAVALPGSVDDERPCRQRYVCVAPHVLDQRLTGELHTNGRVTSACEKVSLVVGRPHQEALVASALVEALLGCLG